MALFAIEPRWTKSPLDPSLWKRTELPDWRLGSHGYRTGRYFAGLDTLEYYPPKRKWRFARANYLEDGAVRRRRGSFLEAMVSRRIIGKRCVTSRTSFLVHPCFDYPAEFRREGAPVDLKVLVVGDSFARPVPAYLCTVFKSVELVDPRHFHECARFARVKLVDYVKSRRPDIVIMLVNPSSLGADIGDRGFASGRSMFDFDLE